MKKIGKWPADEDKACEEPVEVINKRKVLDFSLEPIIGNTLRLFRVIRPVYFHAKIQRQQESITRREKLLLKVLVSRRFHGLVYFRNDFGANLKYLLSPTNQNHASVPGVQMVGNE